MDRGHATRLPSSHLTDGLTSTVAEKVSQCLLDPEVVFGFLSQIHQDAIEGIPQKNAAVVANAVAAALLIHAKPETWRPRPVIESEFGKGSPEERSAVKGEDIA
ncbi:unnamed protein product [Clonostachys rhizophaga]|uniref:Uncharacterized protein n=1 Tax=Clonostachys rhizophaga TaxID=160324 RepID=A0A9N9VCI0_9HYPO|nr:unnamed protein product [Clonostachys rhizophaga]